MRDKRFIRCIQRDFPDIFLYCYERNRRDTGWTVIHHKDSKTVARINGLHRDNITPLLDYYTRYHKECGKEQITESRRLVLKLIKENLHLLIMEIL